LAYRILVVSTITLTAIASCGQSPPSFVYDESDSSAVLTDSGGDSDTDSGADSQADTETGGPSDSILDTETGGESDSSCFDPSGHDEDGDKVHDLCDNCPSVANDKQANGDSDDLGYACEATGRPGVLDRIAVFEPFTEQGSDWDADQGKWSWLSDMVQGSALGGSSEISGFYVHKTQLGNGAYAVEATFYHDQSGSSTDWSPFSGVIFSWAKSDLGRKFWVCLYGWDTRGMSIWRTLDGSIQQSVRRDNVDTSNGDTAIWRRIRAIWDGVGLTCEFGNEIGDFYSLSVPEKHIWKDMSGQAGLRVYNETSSFSSFVIYN
jgi:hypothetical protein